ncbi:exodeoxyribonuclease VII small subunit [Mitsuokella sp. AF21-1AC]|uniref:exodeoxyribonuclease VII small subunit n=1 Tax=Mitsuokella sp. AF21-1AC TaxID=2292235 RepID=UPI000E531572|nr:exodeoxyribonuclease VII small subunit [Mitsuokella sp. AF21-1AC]RGS70908.1 exodeoxyribonuclease VII small subunit [Mitsuokella sp. AF21-1AC]
MPRKKELSFEESLGKLEEIVKTMEEGSLSLRDLMTNYSEGVQLAKNCLTALDRAEKTMDLLVKEGEDGTVKEEQLEIEGE